MNIFLMLNNEKERGDMKNILNGTEYISNIYEITDIYDCLRTVRDKNEYAIILDTENFQSNIIELYDVVKRINMMGVKISIVLIVNENDYVMSSAAYRLGVNFVIKRPYDMKSVIERLIDRGGNNIIKNEDEIKYKKIYIERQVSVILNNSGILPNLKGYKYLKEAIITGYYNGDVLEVVTKRLYPEVAKNNNTTADRVERSIRHALESAWEKCGGSGFYSKLGLSIYSNKRPTNSEYIFAVVEFLNTRGI